MSSGILFSWKQGAGARMCARDYFLRQVGGAGIVGACIARPLRVKREEKRTEGGLRDGGQTAKAYTKTAAIL